MSNNYGEIHRLKSWTSYQPKRPKTYTQPHMLNEGFKTKPGLHTVVVVIGAVREDEDLSEEKVERMMGELGWGRIDER